MGIVNKIRLSRGWNLLPPEDAEITARAWGEILREVPAEHLNALYLEAVDHRVRQIQNGTAVQDLSAELLLSRWNGPEGLRVRLAQKNASKALGEGKATQCGDCFGTGLKYHRDAEGNLLGVGGKCQHENAKAEDQENL